MIYLFCSIFDFIVFSYSTLNICYMSHDVYVQKFPWGIYVRGEILCDGKTLFQIY